LLEGNKPPIAFVLELMAFSFIQLKTRSQTLISTIELNLTFAHTAFFYYLKNPPELPQHSLAAS